MFPHSLFKILLAILFLYFAWPSISLALPSFERYFWFFWLILLLLVLGGNLSTLLKITEAPSLEKDYKTGRKTHKY